MRSQDSAVVVAPPTPSPARLASYLAAGVGSSMLATAEVEGAVVMINLTNVGGTNISGSCAGMSYGAGGFISISNWLGAGTGGLDILRNWSYIGLDGFNGLQFALSAFANSSPRNFALNAEIGATATWSSNATRTTFQSPYLGSRSPDFGPGSFMGFRFGSGSTWNYGYIEVLWTGTGTASASTFQLLSAAYESTPNTPIAAGAVPAPSAFALLALGGGAFRRARQRAA